MKTPRVATPGAFQIPKGVPPHMFNPLAPKDNNTKSNECSSPFHKGLRYKVVSKGVLGRIPGCGRWQTSHCRAIVQAMVRGGPAHPPGSATAHNRGLALFTAGRSTRAKEKKCGHCSVSGSGATFHVEHYPVPCRLSLGVRSLDVDCRWLPVPGGFEVVAGRGGGGDPLGAGHG